MFIYYFKPNIYFLNIITNTVNIPLTNKSNDGYLTKMQHVLHGNVVKGFEINHPKTSLI